MALGPQLHGGAGCLARLGASNVRPGGRPILSFSGLQGSDMRAGTGCPDVHRASDVRGSSGCPAHVESLGVRFSLVFLCLLAPDVQVPTGCPAVVALRRLHLTHFTLRFYVDLSYASSSFMVVSSVPEHMQCLCIRQQPCVCVNGKGKHLGAGSPYVQWHMLELLSYVLLGFGEQLQCIGCSASEHLFQFLNIFLQT